MPRQIRIAPKLFASELLGDISVTGRAGYVNLAAQHNAVEIAVEQFAGNSEESD